MFPVLRGLPVLQGPVDAPSGALWALRVSRVRRVMLVLQGSRVFLDLRGLWAAMDLQGHGACRVRTGLRVESGRRDPLEVQEPPEPQVRTALQDLQETRVLRASWGPKERRVSGVKSSPPLLFRPSPDKCVSS